MVRCHACLAFVSLAVGAGMLAAGGASAPVQKGGTLRVGLVRDLDSVDPAVAYLRGSWAIEYATCAKLYTYPDKSGSAGATVVPEVASAFPEISANGRKQTIRLRRTFRFHTGQPVTAANFVAAFNREANPKMESPAVPYLREIVGAGAVMAGKTQAIAGVRSIGRYILEIRTTRPVPDLVARLTMPFFCPIAVSTPLEEIENPLGSGPYYVASRIPNRQTLLSRNTYYRGSRPANVEQMLFTIAGNESCRVAVEQDELDYCFTTPSNSTRELASAYGINRKDGQFFFNATLGFDYFAFNHDRPAFKGRGQIPLKQAINWAIDRPALVRAVGYLAGRRTDQILPVDLTRPASIYPLGGVSQRTLARARRLVARAAYKPDKLVVVADDVFYHAAWAQIFQFNMRRLGIDVQIKIVTRAAFFDYTATRGQPFDVVVTGGWLPDYPDPVTVFGPLLDGDTLAPSGNANVAYFDRPEITRKIHAAATLSGTTRRSAFARLDRELMRDDPPWAPVLDFAVVSLVSKSYGCFVFQPVLATPDFVAACKK